MKLKSKQWHWTMAGLYLLLALALTWPLTPQIFSHLPNLLSLGAGDTNMFVWLMDWTAQALTGGLPVAADKMLFWPHGVAPWAGFDGPLMLLVGVPLIWLTGNPVFAYNVFFLVCLVGAALAAYGLAWRLTRSVYGAAIAGGLFGFSTFILVRGLQHPNLLIILVIPLLAWAAFSFMEKPSAKGAFALAGATLLTALSSWYYLAGALIFLLIAGLWRVRFMLKPKNRKLTLLAAVLISVAILLPAAPLLLTRTADVQQTDSFHYDHEGARPANFLLPHPYTNILGQQTAGVYDSFLYKWRGPSLWESTSHFGLPVLVLLLAFVIWRKRYRKQRPWFWLTTLAVFTVLSMGTFVELFGWKTPLPFDLLRRVFPFDGIRSPNRLFVFALMASSAIAGIVLADLSRLLKRNALILLTVPLLALLLAERAILPYPTLHQPVPEFYRELAADPETFAIADLPIWYPGYSTYDYYQTVHHKPTVTGEWLWVSYRPAQFELIKTNPLLQISQCPRDPGKPDMATFEPPTDSPDYRTAMEGLAANGVRYVVLHNLILQNDSACRRTKQRLREFFAGREHIYADGLITVYSTTVE